MTPVDQARLIADLRACSDDVRAARAELVNAVRDAIKGGVEPAVVMNEVMCATDAPSLLVTDVVLES